MKIPAFILGASAAALVHGDYVMAGAMFSSALVVLVHLWLPPSRCNQVCRQGRGCDGGCA